MSLRRAGPAPGALLAATLAGCLGGLRQDPGPTGDCPAVAAAPVPAALASLLAGEFDLILIATSIVSATPTVERAGSGADTREPGQAAARSAVGRLVLRSSGSPPPDAPPGSPLGGPPPAFIGWAQIDLARVGAAAAGSLGEGDSAAPGVGAYLLDPREWGGAGPGADSTAEPEAEAHRVVVRLGAEANRRERVRFDGAHTTLSVGSIDSAGFAGSWMSAGGAEAASGHFCARRR